MRQSWQPLFFHAGVFQSERVFSTAIMPAGYVLAIGIPPSNMLGQRSPESPLSILTDDRPGLRGLQMMGTDSTGDKAIVKYRGYFGIAVYNRSLGSALDMVSGSNTYTDPKINWPVW